ncbi:substrate-binding domain-containing protein [Clostridium intestinale]|uniref:substrate-binding domain-containing protein n=1 Tax=Clostridium intestinale TaxID=36845 RepID=UPI002DD65016|nr:substrate-binding domain-containing protein [Clostridium intestinale]WRY51693.1 substrate-binding domain-containing protein [Clostridium intestinale]
MKSKKTVAFIILFLLLIISFSVLLDDTLSNQKNRKIHNISLITSGKNNESLMIMKQGVEQAASELNIDVSFINLSQDNNIDEQKELIDREIKNGADAIILSPVDYEKMANTVEEAMKKVPIILIESNVDLEKPPPIIWNDNYELGELLGEQMIEMGDMGKKVAIIKNNLECKSIADRYEGFMSVMNKINNTYLFWEIPNESQANYYTEIKNLLENNDVDVVVTLSTGMLEYVAEVKKDSNIIDNEKSSIKVYGTGSTSKIISALEEKNINATATQNEFNIGYLGVKAAVDKLEGKKISNSTISSTIVNTDNMYSKENQRLLFPLIR